MEQSLEALDFYRNLCLPLARPTLRVMLKNREWALPRHAQAVTTWFWPRVSWILRTNSIQKPKFLFIFLDSFPKMFGNFASSTISPRRCFHVDKSCQCLSIRSDQVKWSWDCFVYTYMYFLAEELTFAYSNCKYIYSYLISHQMEVRTLWTRPHIEFFNI